MNLRIQKELAARYFGVSKDRIKFRIKSEEDLERIKSLMTREGVKELFNDGIIIKLPKRGNSRTRANFIKLQKRKGRRRGYGSRKGTKNSRKNTKELWIIKIRALRKLIKKLKEENKINKKVYRDLYKKTKSNIFRNKKHLMLYLEQEKLLNKEE